MADTLTKPYPLAVEVSGHSGDETGWKIWFTNRTTGTKASSALDSDGHTILDIYESLGTITHGDVIEIRLFGKYEAYSTHTVDTGQDGADVSLTATALSANTPEVAI